MIDDEDDNFRLLRRKLRKTLHLYTPDLFYVKLTGMLCFFGE